MPSLPIPDPKKGEQLVLFTTDPGSTASALRRR